MGQLATFARYVFAAVCAGIAAVVSYQLLTRHIITNGLLRDKATGKVSAARIQLFITMLVTLTYTAGMAPMDERGIDLGTPLLALVAGSEGVFLLNKYLSHWRGQAAQKPVPDEPTAREPAQRKE